MPTTTIGSDVFEIVLLDGWESFLLSPLVAPIVSEAAPAIARALVRVLGAAGGEVSKLDGAALLAALANLDVAELLPIVDHLATAVANVATILPREKLDTLARTLLGGARVQLQGAGKWIPLFTGNADPVRALPVRALTLWRLFAFAISENYADFFDVLRASGSAAAPASPSAASSISAP